MIHPDGIVQVWGVPSGKPIWSLREELDPEVGMAWMPDWSGVVLARSNVVEVVRRGQPDSRLQLQGHGFPVRRLAISPDGRRVAAVAVDDTVRIWDAVKGRELSVFPVVRRCESLFFGVESGRLVVIGEQEAVAYNAETGERLARMVGGLERNSVVMPDPEGERYVTAGAGEVDGTSQLRLWTTNGLVSELGVGQWFGLPRTVFSPDRDAFCIGGHGFTASIRDSRTGKLLMNIPLRVNSGAFSPDGRRLATHGGTSTIHIWEPDHRRELMQIKGHREIVQDVAFSPDGRLLASISERGSVKVWSAMPGREIFEYGGLPWGLAHTSDGRRLINAYLPDWIAIRDTASGRLLAQLRRLHRMTLTLAISPDDRLLAAGDALGEIAIWEMATGRLLRILRGHEQPVSIVSFSRDGRLLGSAGFDGTVRIWDPDSGRQLLDFKQTKTLSGALDFSPDGKRLALRVSQGSGYGTDAPTLELWDFESGRQLLTFRGFMELGVIAGFSPCGRRLVSDWWDSKVRQWEAFPWTDAEYSGSPEQSLQVRIRNYARSYWQERLEAERRNADTNTALIVEVSWDRSRIPARDPITPRNLADLSGHYTGLLSECSYIDFNQAYMGIDLRNAPTGLVTFDNVQFDVRGVIQLGSSQSWASDHASDMGPIHVNQRCRQLHAILGSVGRAAEGEAIGALVLRYADSSQYELDILYGQHVRHWWTHGDPRTDTVLARVAWEGPHAAPHIHPTRLRIYHAAWDSPRPDQEIVSFDFVSKMTTTAAPFLIAVTLE
jgi:WD40 repeat protein